MSTVVLSLSEVGYLLTHRARVNPCEGVKELIPSGLFEKRLMYEPLKGCYALTREAQDLIPQLEAWMDGLSGTISPEITGTFALPDQSTLWRSEGMRLLGAAGQHYYIGGDAANVQRLVEVLNHLQVRSDRLTRLEDGLKLVVDILRDGLGSPNGSE